MGVSETGDWIAVDWGSSSRRAFRLDAAGAVGAVLRDDRGVARFARDAFPAEVQALREALGDLPVLAAGMIGSTRGWREAPYAALPAGLETLAAGAVEAGDRFTLVPGLRQDGAGREDVMRGEEVLVLGAVHAGLVPGDTLVCQPGTHSKWVRVAGGRIVGFVTALTGELFALLRDASLLSEMMGGPVGVGPAFLQGVARGAGGSDLLGALFGVRAGVLLGARPAEGAAAYASGLLIGADCGARELPDGGEVALVADARLGPLYAAALEALGARVRSVDSEAAFLAGIGRIRELRS